MSKNYQDPFVTVVSVGTEDKSQYSTPKKAVNNSEYITVLTIGNEETKTIKDVTEEVVVYRLPGERLGFGLKFEGGTKAHEFVKRLFIQSCASDSPASRVQSSWGQLVEEDEILEIDSISVNSMTRIDCVRFLKDSNVAIKLLVKHCFRTKQMSKSVEDLPVIISTEEKKPPPVPPRKLHRKLHKCVANSENVHDSIVPTLKQTESFSNKSSRLQSPRNSFRKKYSPDVSRRLSDFSLGPPDAEVFLDLISQESTQSLSESDDTGSTISTVLDRFASFPTTTTSSFAGSLPSTPTSVQKHLDLSYIINDFPEDDLFPIIDKMVVQAGMIEENNNIVDGTDKENARCIQKEKNSSSTGTVDYVDSSQPEKNQTLCSDTPKRPVIIPRSRDKINKSNSCENEDTLPRLVDFVPKYSTNKGEEKPMDTLIRFLESERLEFEYTEDQHLQENDMEYMSNEMDMYSSKWLLSSHLSTIGEDEEEVGQDLTHNYGSSTYTPCVTIENIEFNGNGANFIENDDTKSEKEKKSKDNQMEIPPSDSRQPPDGHEFPDFIETTTKVVLANNHFKIEPVECATHFKSSWTDLSPTSSMVPILDRSISSSNCDLRPKITESDEEKEDDFGKSNLLHTRSQSLIDMSIFSKEKSSRWNVLAETRKRRLSKLKGLVIPEAPEHEVTPCVYIPEIKSVTTPSMDIVRKPEVIANGPAKPVTNTASPVVLPSWSSNTSIPKYSPAFKRKSFQVYPVSTKNSEDGYDDYMSKFCNNTTSGTNDDPRSLESIASPTRSDCSFDYISSKTISIRDQSYEKLDNAKYLGKHEDESDNDSAVSSSQSSYNSRCSPPPSPIPEENPNGQNRMLKPFSVEAINRKNILASAKCRSGKDFKIGSPVIKRKDREEGEVAEAMEVEAYSATAAIIIDNESPVLEEEVIDQNLVLEEPVQSKISSIKQNEQVEEKPTPSKRTALPKVNIIDLVDKPRPKRILEKQRSISSYLEKRAPKPVNVKNLTKNFENSSASSMPVFPKNFKVETKSTPLAKLPESIKPSTTPRRMSEDCLITVRRKSEDKPILRPSSLGDSPKVGSRRLSNTKNEIRISTKEIGVVESPSREKEVIGSLSSEIRTIDLNLEQVGGSLGITIAGGADYETKTISVHRIRYGSVAYQDGRLKKGDKIISINGHHTAGLSHTAATELLKEPCIKFNIVVEESKEIVPSSNLSRRSSSSATSLLSEKKGADKEANASYNKVPTHTVSLTKDRAGLGFSIEGGKDSPKGDVPLVIKKIFSGGAADKCGQLQIGDEIVSLNDTNYSNLSRIEAWSLMKKIPEGLVKIEVFR